MSCSNAFFTGIISFFIMLISTETLAQCGVVPALSCSAGGIMETNINAGATTFSPNWRAYAWQWEVNNQIASNDSILISPLGFRLPVGFSNVCLKVFATDTITNDSCTKQVCNIFQSTGNEVFAELEVSATGLTATAWGYWFGGDPIGSFVVDIDWGDGANSPTVSDVHTYAAAGDYLVCFSVLDMSGFSITTCRKVQVDNGLPNMAFSPMQGTFSSCYPFSLQSPISSPAYSSGYGSLYSYATVPTVAPFGYGTPLLFPLSSQYPVVPGQAIWKGEINDINPGNLYPIDKYAPVYFDVCGVIPDTIKGYVFDDLDTDGIKDAGEPGVANQRINVTPQGGGLINYYALTDTAGFYSILCPNASVRLNLQNSYLPAGYGLTLPGTSFYTIDAVVTNTFPLYNFGVASLNTTISGNVYLDYNHDSIRVVPPDAHFKNVTVKAESTTNGLIYYEHTNSTGSYTFKVPSGNYKITPTAALLDSVDYYPDTIFVNSTGGTFNNQHFGCYSTVKGNMGVRIFGSSEARPGFNYQNTIEVSNTGFDTLTGTVVFTFDAILTPNSVVPPSGVVDNINHTVTWATGNILPATQQYYGVDYTIPIPTPLGTVMNFSAQANVNVPFTDSDLSNNFDPYQQTVIGSFDPNDKQVDPAGLGISGDVLHSQRLHYRIRFQNTGTASAIHVFVQDELDPDLDMNTFLMERASHTYDVVTNGNTVTWKFININLPDSNSNEPGSHGYLEYSIKPIQGLMDGTEIQNTAAIYFDYNSPVITNTTTNTLQTSLSSIADPESEQWLSLFPVPVKNEITMVAETGNNDNVRVDLIDINGRLVRNIYEGVSKGTLRMNINTATLSHGTYMIRVLSSNRMMRRVFVKE